MRDDIRIRAAEPGDGEMLGKMAGALVRFHHELDPKRFFIMDGIEKGYGRFLESQIGVAEVLILVALSNEKPVGYVYARLEPRDWNALRDACGELHDIFVMEGARRSGIGTALLDTLKAKFAALGAPRIVLSTAFGNDAAQRLFVRHGFRPTMIEMTAEL